MRPGSGVKADNCPCCKVCTNCPGIKKVLAVPEAGYVLYRHTTRVEDVNKKTGAIETTTDTIDDVFIVENTQGGHLGKIDVTPEIDSNKIKCPRCVHILKHAQTLFQNQDIGKNDVMGICEHCRKFGSTCVKCEMAIEKFQQSKKAERQGHAQRVKTWLSKIQQIIKLSLFEDKKNRNQPGQMVRGYSDVDLNNLLRQIKTDREPEIEDLFLHGIRDFYASKRGPLSERPYYPGAITDKGVVFDEAPKLHDDKQKERYATDSLLPSNITLAENDLEKDFVRRYGKSYKSNIKYSSPADSKWLKDADFMSVGEMQPDLEKLMEEPIAPYDKKIGKDKTREERSVIDTKRHSEEKPKDFTFQFSKTDKFSAAKVYEDEITKKDEGKRAAADKTYVGDIRKGHEEGRQKKYIADEKFYGEDRKKKEFTTADEKSPSAKVSGKKIEGKPSVETKIIYESPSRVRKYRSEESLLTGMTKMKDDVQKHETFDYYFPETKDAGKKEKGKRVVSSTELIRDTLNKLKTKIEEEKRKREEAERLKEERRKRLEREKKEREEKLLAQMGVKALEKQPKEEEKGKHDVSKEKITKDEVVKENIKKEPKKKEKPIEKAEKQVKEPKVKEEKVKEPKVKEEKVKEPKVKEEKPKVEKVKEDKSKELKIKDDLENDKQKRDLQAQELKKSMEQQQAEREKEKQALKLEREEATRAKLEAQKKAKEDAEKKKLAMQKEMPEQMFELTKIEIKRPSIYDLIKEHKFEVRAPPKEFIMPKHIDIKRHKMHGKKESSCDLCNDSEFEMDVLNVLWKRDADKVDKKSLKEVVLGEEILKYRTKFGEEEPKDPHPPSLFQRDFGDNYGTIAATQENLPQALILKPPKSEKLEQDSKGVVRYSLSDRTFIDKGWTKLPTEKVVRKMNVYRMRPAHPEFDWFEHNKKKGQIQYDTGEKLAEFEENGRGRWYYRSGLLALDHYNAEEMNAQQRFVVYSSGEPDERGRSRPRAVLATFDYLGNGIVFDHTGKIRLKYNQTEGIILDRALGPVSHWKWHALNDPPVLQQVMIDTQMSHKDPDILKLGGPGENKPRPDDDEMLAIEFDNFIKEKSAKLSQSFKPFQIKMKALKINENFSLRVLDQANVYLIYRDGTTNIKLNIGMILDHKEIVDTDTAEVGEVSSNLERLPAKTDSLAELQRNVANAQTIERTRFERDKRINRPQHVLSVDWLKSAASKPLKVPLTTVDSTTSGVSRFCKCRKPSACNVYYGTGLV